jgi:phosphate transport system permease protein
MAAAETSRLAAGGRVRRRKRLNRLVEGVWLASSVLAVAVLALVTLSVLVKALPGLDPDLFTKTPATFGEAGGGIAHAFIGSIVLVLMATAIALPVGVLIAIYVNEFAHQRVARWLKLMLALALSIIMVPIISRTTMEVLALVPNALREGSLALGVSKWRTIVGVILPTTLSGILTGGTLAMARAAGETAPLLFTTSLYGNSVSWDPNHALASIPVTIYIYSEAPDKHLNDQAWAAAFVLIMFVLVTSLVSRALLARSRRKLERG